MIATILSMVIAMQQAPANQADAAPAVDAPMAQQAPPPPVIIPQGEAEASRPSRAGTSAQNAPSRLEMTPESEEATRRAMRYLASMQNEDGSFGRGRFARHVGITALCGLAFMADGNLPGRGPYGDAVRRALEFVLKNATETGLLAAENGPVPAAFTAATRNR